MNLKESFRYQKFLDTMMGQARRSLYDQEHALKETRKHLRSKSNPEAEDVTEEIKPETPFFQNDDVIRFMCWLVSEREKLSLAIGEAKANSGINIDAAIDTNKFRHLTHAAIKYMLDFHGSKTVTQGRDFKFDVNGVQAPYYYDVEVVKEEAFNRDAARDIMREMITEADTVSADIDAALINIQVDYTPRFDVNDTFHDVMTDFIAGYSS